MNVIRFHEWSVCESQIVIKIRFCAWFERSKRLCDRTRDLSGLVISSKFNQNTENLFLSSDTKSEVGYLRRKCDSFIDVTNQLIIASIDHILEFAKHAHTSFHSDWIERQVFCMNSRFVIVKSIYKETECELKTSNQTISSIWISKWIHFCFCLMWRSIEKMWSVL